MNAGQFRAHRPCTGPSFADAGGRPEILAAREPTLAGPPNVPASSPFARCHLTDDVRAFRESGPVENLGRPEIFCQSADELLLQSLTVPPLRKYYWGGLGC